MRVSALPCCCSGKGTSPHAGGRLLASERTRLALLALLPFMFVLSMLLPLLVWSCVGSARQSSEDAR